MSSSDNIYVNVGITNNTIDPDEAIYKLAVYDNTLTVPISNKSNDCFASIVRFSIPTQTIPILIFPLDVNQTNPNLSILEIGILTSTGSEFPTRVIYLPQNDIDPPNTPIIGTPPYFSINDTISPYYNIYNIQPFLNMVNNALSTSITNSGLGVPAPFYIFDPQTELISLIVTQNFISSGAQIFLNSCLAQYFGGFFFNTQLINVIGGYDNLFIHNLSNIPFGSTVGGPYRFIQEYSSIPKWFDITKIVVTSSSLQAVQEYNPLSSNNQTINFSANQIPIITDFAASFPSLKDYSSTLIYNPSSQYRLIDITSSSPVSRLQFQFFWMNRNNQLIPLSLSPNQSIELKLAFVNKNLYKGNTNTFK